MDLKRPGVNWWKKEREEVAVRDLLVSGLTGDRSDVERENGFCCEIHV
jgi:hypothetical protein